MIDPTKIDLIANYRIKIVSASKELTKKEIFKDLLHRLYPNSIQIGKVIDSMSSGSERSILNIPRADKLHKGSADTLYNQIIIEFENDLKKTGKHAIDQLAGYLLGQFNSGEGYNYTLIASDFINWKVYAPDISQIPNLNKLNEAELKLIENLDASFTLKEGNEEDFFYWIDRFLFREQKIKATLSRIEDAFGHKSALFFESLRIIESAYTGAKMHGQVQVSYDQWKRFLSIAYGKFDSNERVFLIHTYLSVFSKLLAFSIVSKKESIDEDTIKSVLEGTIFETYNIKGFVENDFFHWVTIDSIFKKIVSAFRLISQEINGFDFENVDEDILKGVYQELIDLDTRHSLGEYYTPDWLCERVLQEYNIAKGEKLLDPSCGSGSFLRAFIQRLKQLHPGISANEINEAVYGIDIHPLSVQIAKTTVLIALGKEASELLKPIRLNVIMANTLLAPDDTLTLYDNDFKITIDKETKIVSTSILDNPKLYDDTLDFINELAEINQGKSITDKVAFGNSLQKLTSEKLSKQFIDSFFEIYESLKKAKENKRDSIWKFILSNTYKPYFLKAKFDYIIGNPPWFTYSSIKNEEYQELLLKLANKYQVVPKRKANMPHLEIAAIFMAHCSSYFLKELNGKKGKLAFVLPRSFFSADQHDNTRSGDALGFKLSAAWDLIDVSPLFRVPSCVLFAEKANGKRALDSSGLCAKLFQGNLPKHNIRWEVIENIVSEINTTYTIGKLGKSSAFVEGIQDKEQKYNPYKNKFKQGATIVPRTFYFVEISSANTSKNLKNRILQVKTADSIKSDAKAPWKEIDFKQLINSETLFYTVLSKSVIPYCILSPELVNLPIEVIEEKNKKYIKMNTVDDLVLRGQIDSAKWFRNCENIWNIHRTEKSESMEIYDRINFQRGITDQNLNKRYIVIYNASAKDANAGVVDRENYELEFIVESKVYAYYTEDLKEAYYLVSILNSQYANLKIKDFQSKGLFGPRDVHKKILDVYFPEFNPKKKSHLNLAKKAEDLSVLVNQIITEKDNNEPLTAIKLGKLRSEIKKTYNKEFTDIEKLISKVIEEDNAS